MTRLDEIRAHDAGLGPTAELGGVYRHRRWLIAQVDALATALREVESIAADKSRKVGMLTSSQLKSITRNALAALTAPEEGKPTP